MMGRVFAQAFDLDRKPLVLAREPFRILADHLDDVVLVDRLKCIPVRRREALEKIVKILFFHGVVHDQLTKELIEYIRAGLRLLVELSEDGMVGNKGINYVHTASNHVIGLKLSSDLQNFI
jgi:L-cysteine desulfidase